MCVCVFNKSIQQYIKPTNCPEYFRLFRRPDGTYQITKLNDKHEGRELNEELFKHLLRFLLPFLNFSPAASFMTGAPSSFRISESLETLISKDMSGTLISLFGAEPLTSPVAQCLRIRARSHSAGYSCLSLQSLFVHLSPFLASTER